MSSEVMNMIVAANLDHERSMLLSQCDLVDQSMPAIEQLLFYTYLSHCAKRFIKDRSET